MNPVALVVLAVYLVAVLAAIKLTALFSVPAAAVVGVAALAFAFGFVAGAHGGEDRP